MKGLYITSKLTITESQSDSQQTKDQRKGSVINLKILAYVLAEVNQESAFELTTC